MRVHIILATLVCFFLSITTPAISATAPPSANIIIPDGGIYKKIVSLKIKDIQKLVGRKLTIKEKISFLILKHKLKRQSKENATKGQTAFIFGLVGLGLLIVGLFVPYVILGSLVSAILAIVTGSMAKKADPSDRKAHAGKLLGWITLGLIALLFILAAVIIASSSWW
jgi:hypothetical protein